jgi:hypothetical protein
MAMSFGDAEGFARPFDEDGQPYTTFGNQIPALRSFYLAYDIGDTSPDDHEIKLLQVLAGGASFDLTPDFVPDFPIGFFPAADFPDGQLHVALQDRSPSEEFFYRVSHATLDVPGARRFQIRDVGCSRACTRTLPAEILPEPSPVGTAVIALVGFKLFFIGDDDYQIDRVGVWFDGPDLNVALDNEDGNTFAYLVDFVVIPTVGLNVTTGIERGSAVGGEQFSLPTPPSRSEYVLTGWALNFTNGVHEIRELGFDRRGDDVPIIYADKNADDPFDWRLEWALVGPQVFA